MNIFLVALASITLSVIAQFMLKAGMSSPAVKAVLSEPLGLQTAFAVLLNPKVLAGFMFYGLGAVVWLAVLARWDVSKAYPLVGLGFAMTVMIGLVLGEQVSLVRAIGVALICAGVFVVSRT